MRLQSRKQRILLKEYLDSLGVLNERFRAVSECEVWEYEKNTYVVDIPQNSVEGLITREGRVVSKNMLLANFWILWVGLLRDVNAPNVVDYYGSTYTLRTSGDVNYGYTSIDLGIGTTPVSFSDYKLDFFRLNISVDPVTTVTDTYFEVSYTVKPDIDCTEIGMRQVLYDAAGYGRLILLSRTLGRYPANQPVTYRLRLYKPWCLPAFRLLYGILTNTDVGVECVERYNITLRTSGDVNAGPVYLVYSTTYTSWSTSIVRIPDAVSLTTYYGDGFTRGGVATFLTGVITPSTDTDVRVLGGYQKVFDTAGYTWTILIFMIPLETPITFKANRLNTVVIRVGAS